MKIFYIRKDKIKNTYLNEHISDHKMRYFVINCNKCDKTLGYKIKNFKGKKGNEMMEFGRESLVKRITKLTIADEFDEELKKINGKYVLSIEVEES